MIPFASQTYDSETAASSIQEPIKMDAYVFKKKNGAHFVGPLVEAASKMMKWGELRGYR